MDIFPRMLCIDFRCYLSVSSLGLATPRKIEKDNSTKRFGRSNLFSGVGGYPIKVLD